MATKDFDAMLAEKARIRPTFIVGGQTFTARAKLPYLRFQKLMAAMGDDEMDPNAATEMFFRTVIVKDDRERFIELLNADGDEDEDAVVGVTQLNEITEWLLEIYTGKAGPSSGESSNGPGTTGVQRNVVSLTPRAG